MCEKLSKSLEAVAELEAGVGFDKVAAKYSEDKARTGGNLGYAVHFLSLLLEMEADERETGG